jgi:tyrosyl-tRNA synthetase
MTTYHSDFLRICQERGFIFQGTDLKDLDHKCQEGPIRAYLGFDGTASSLHVGSLLQIMWLRLLQKTGHKPIVLMGDGTTRIGDPSGKDAARQLLSDEKINENITSMSRIFSKFLTLGDGPTDALMVRNSAWLSPLNYIDFLRDYGRHFSVNRMLSFDSVKLRLDREQPLSFLEFNYMVFQAYDFLHLYRSHGCTLQMGGSDQWGNIINGVDLIRRCDQGQAYGLTAPLITTAQGAKMGKTAQGAIWLNEDMLSPYDYWQFWRNTHDQDVGRFLRYFTDLPMDEIHRLEKLEGSELNDGKIILADHATALCHGDEALRDVKRSVDHAFGSGEGGLEALPTVYLDDGKILSLLDVLKELGFATSKGEGRRLIQGGGVKLDDHLVTEEDMFIDVSQIKNDFITVKVGKKRHGIIRVRGA